MNIWLEFGLLAFTGIGCLVYEHLIYKYVRMEYEESKETNKVLMTMLNKQKKQKRKISVDRIIKTAIQGEGN